MPHLNTPFDLNKFVCLVEIKLHVGITLCVLIFMSCWKIFSNKMSRNHQVLRTKNITKIRPARSFFLVQPDFSGTATIFWRCNKAVGLTSGGVHLYSAGINFFKKKSVQINRELVLKFYFLLWIRCIDLFCARTTGYRRTDLRFDGRRKHSFSYRTRRVWMKWCVAVRL